MDLEACAMLERMRLRDWLFFALMLLGIGAAIYHMANGRVMNGILVLGGIIVGSVVRFTIILDPEREPVERAAAPPARSLESRLKSWLRREDDADGDIWLRSGVIAGFVATVIMSGVLVLGYLSAGIFADEEGGTIARWFYGLTHNSLTDDAIDIPLGAYSVNLLAGIIWALVYAAVIEPRLSGPGWWRGLKFSLLPWLLSLVVFFPAVGAGFFGASLDAGPLPAIGNLILHLAYGAMLGVMYAIPETSAPDPADKNAVAAAWSDRGLAIGLTVGLMIGVIGGAIAGALFGNGRLDSTEFILAGAASGIMAGALVGPLAGLEAGSSHPVAEAG
jgi:hypothetical protein